MFKALSTGVVPNVRLGRYILVRSLGMHMGVFSLVFYLISANREQDLHNWIEHTRMQNALSRLTFRSLHTLHPV